MRELYDYMNQQRDSMYSLGKRTVTLDIEHFFRLHHLVCSMMQVRNIVNQDENLEKMLKAARGERSG